jgi:hypothetical protein
MATVRPIATLGPLATARSMAATEADVQLTPPKYALYGA